MWAAAAVCFSHVVETYVCSQSDIVHVRLLYVDRTITFWDEDFRARLGLD